MVRSAFRVAELAHGFRSKLANNQTAFIILESCVMVFATFLLTAFHPGRYIGEEWKNSGWGVKKSSNIIALNKLETEQREFDQSFNQPWPIQH
jgi:hypothetical protein